MKGLRNLAQFLYDWKFLNHHEGPEDQYFSYLKDVGMVSLLIILIVVSLAAALYYYYGVARNVSAATKKNYVIIGLCGLILMVVSNFLIIYLLTKWNTLMSLNMWKLTLLDVVYYIILWGVVWSGLLKSKSNASNIWLISLFK